VDPRLRLREHQRELRVGVKEGPPQGASGGMLVPRALTAQAKMERRKHTWIS